MVLLHINYIECLIFFLNKCKISIKLDTKIIKTKKKIDKIELRMKKSIYIIILVWLRCTFQAKLSSQPAMPCSRCGAIAEYMNWILDKWH